MPHLYEKFREGESPTSRRLEALLAHAREVVTVFDREGSPLYRSPAFARILGYSRDEVAESAPFELVHPNDRENARDVLAWSIDHPGERSEPFEFRLRAADGSWRTCEGTMTNLLDDPDVLGVVGNWRDVTRFRETERILRELVDSIEGVFWMRDVREDRFVYLSPSIEEKLGIRREDAMADPDAWIEAIHPEDRDRVRTARLEGRLEDEQEYRIVRWGETRWIRDHAFPVRQRVGELTRVAGIALDVTERKQAREAIRASEQRFMQAQKMEAIGRLAGGIAHDFNNLLTAIRGHGHLVLERDDLEPGIRESVEEIDRAARRAADLTRQLLAYGRRQEHRSESIDLDEAVREFVSMIDRVMPESIELRTRLEAESARVRIDRGRLEQVLLNLAVNARDAMPEGGELTIATDELTVDSGSQGTVLSPGTYVRLTVEDTGTGMEPDTRRHAFEPFYTTKPTGEGSGLGLSTVYGIVTQSGGEARIESEPGEGTAVRIALPLEEAGEVVRKPRPPSVSTPSGDGETILLVEDDKRIRKLAARALTDQGYRVVEAEDGEHALELLENRDESPDLVLTDVVMPRMGGPELVRQLKDRGYDPMVLYTTGFSDERLSEEDREVAGSLLAKPFTPAQLARRVRELLG